MAIQPEKTTVELDPAPRHAPETPDAEVLMESADFHSRLIDALNRPQA